MFRGSSGTKQMVITRQNATGCRKIHQNGDWNAFMYMYFVILSTFFFVFSNISNILLLSAGRGMQSLLKCTELSPVRRIYRATIFG